MKIPLDQKDLNTDFTIIIPININNQHWVCSIIQQLNKKIKIYYFNSIKNDTPKIIEDCLYHTNLIIEKFKLGQKIDFFTEN